MITPARTVQPVHGIRQDPRTEGTTPRPALPATPASKQPQKPAAAPTIEQAQRGLDELNELLRHTRIPDGPRPAVVRPTPTTPPGQRGDLPRPTKHVPTTPKRIPRAEPKRPDAPKQPDQPFAHGLDTEVNNRSVFDQRKNVDAKIQVETPDGKRHTLTDKIDIEDKDASYNATFELKHDGVTYKYKAGFDVDWDDDRGQAPHTVTPGPIKVSVDGGPFTAQRAPEVDGRYKAGTPKVDLNDDATTADVSLQVQDADGTQHTLHGEYDIPHRWGQANGQIDKSVTVSGEIDGKTVRYEVPVSIDLSFKRIGEWDAGTASHASARAGKPTRLE